VAIVLANLDPQPIVAVLPGLQIVQRLGPGGQKAVWECTYLGQRYALKVIIAEPGSAERAKRELEVYRRCNSPFLPRVGPLALTSVTIGPDPADAVLYYLEEFVDGLTLEQITRPRLPRDVIAMANCIIDAIQELWKNGFVHRDIKPANIVRKANMQEYVLLDAGLALDAAGPSLTQTGGIVGTTGYRSPDQLQMNKRDLDFRSDLFALGICMYNCLTGEHPFWNQDLPGGDVHHNTLQYASPYPQRWNSALPPDLCDVVMRLLEKERHLRYSRFDHLRIDLNRIVI
jgi:serine/threonine protein kinase